MIWFKKYDIQEVIKSFGDTMITSLGIHDFTLGDNFISARFTIDKRHIQPMQILHGGCSVVLAETLGSVAAGLVVDSTKYYCVGLDINANHLRQAKIGETITGKATPIHIGRKTQVWNIEITNEEDKMVCVSRLTMAVLPINPKN